MTRVLYIGDPSSVHDLKWVSFFSTRPDFEAYFLVQEHEMHLITPDRKKQFGELGITVEGPIKSYSLWRFWENHASINKIKEVIAKRKIDVVHPLFATPFSLWTRNLPVPSIITCRGSDIHVVLTSLGKGSFLKMIHGKLLLKRFQSAFENAAAITCTSQGQLDRINSIFGTNLKAEIIRTGVNVKEIDHLEPKLKLPPIFSGKKIIFLPRYIRPIYQTELQLKALLEIPENLRPQLALVLVKGNRTPDSYMAKIERLLKECGLPYHIFESLTQYEMWSMFKLGSLAIMTPKTDGTPNSALEGMAAKCPLILGSFQYDEDLFSDQFCRRMKTDSVDELTELITESIQNYPQEKINAAFVNVSKHGNRPVEMERLKALYLSLAEQ
ncbi:MAG: glycosyltransferase family 4 protein [Flavobacteriales bacterium]|nr:glycosyltransferase family 4 protein [Flavobacteriales bacterium]